MAGSGATARTTLTAQDVAEIAGVQRPTVSYWRKRPRVGGEEIRFPRPFELRGRVEHFDRDEVVEWLRRTGRGNNPEFAQDAVAAALPAGADLVSLTSLLLLHRQSRGDLARWDEDALVDLADEIDPDDDLLLGEVEALVDSSAEDALRLAAYVDELVAACFGYGDALDRLRRGRLKREALRTELADDLVDLVAESTVSLTTGVLAGATAAIVDASGGGSDLALRVTRRLPEEIPVSLAIPGDTPAARQLRRAAALHDIDVRTGLEGPAVVLLSVVGVDPDEALRRIDDLQLETTEARPALVVGPASLLCDAVSSRSLDQFRADVLRAGELRFAGRLPSGLWLPAPRQHLGLWALGSSPTGRIADRTLVVADVADGPLSTETVSTLAADVLAATGDVRAHGFAHGRVLRTSSVLSADAVVPAGIRAVRLGTPGSAESALEVDVLLRRSRRPLTPAAATLEAEAADRRGAPSRTLGELVDGGILTLLSGVRLEDDLRRESGTVRVLDPTGARADRCDPLALASRHPRAVRTEPGDVVFATTPRPCALVDEEGGGVVAYPARILRPGSAVAPAPYLLAAALGARPESARAWRSWRVPVLEETIGSALDEALRRIAAERCELLDRVETIEELAARLVDAVAAGAVTVTPTDRPQEGA